VGPVRGNTAAVRQAARRRFVEGLFEHLNEGGLGHVSEIADGSAPFTPKGCPFQAWSVGELLRIDRVILAERTRPRAARESGNGSEKPVTFDQSPNRSSSTD
jgi:glycogen debranching enzyme